MLNTNAHVNTDGNPDLTVGPFSNSNYVLNGDLTVTRVSIESIYSETEFSPELDNIKDAITITNVDNLYDIPQLRQLNFKSVDLTGLRFINSNLNIFSIDNINDLCFYKCTFNDYCSFSGLFSETRRLNSVSFIECDLTNIEDMQDMFRNSSVTKITFVNNKHRRPNETKGTLLNTSSMFRHAINLSEVIFFNFDTSGVVDMNHMFAECDKLTSLEFLKDLDVSNVTNMSSMFKKCHRIKTLEGLNKWNVSNVTNMRHMFHLCNLDNVRALSKWNVGNAKNMYGMFANNRIKSLDGFTEWYITEKNDIMDMFANNPVKDITGIKMWHFRCIGDVYEAFGSDRMYIEDNEMLQESAKLCDELIEDMDVKLDQ